LHRSRGIAARPEMRSARRVAAAFGLLAIAGCATLPAPRDAAAPQFPQLQSSYEVTGRLSARHGADAFAASFRWSHEGDRDELDLASPLGQTVARLRGDTRGVELLTPDGKVVSANGWEALTSRGLGWELPVAGLSYWIQGAPRKDSPFTSERADDGALRVLRQDGWTIAFQAFRSDASGIRRPARMTLDYPGVELRLVIDTWQ
jgi:outer membrane lipoprotein LolB